MMKKQTLTILLAGFALACTAQAQTVIADIDDHFLNGENDAFSYFWNATGVALGTAANYTALDGSTATTYFVDATDPSDDFTNSNNDAKEADARLGIKFDDSSARWMLGGQDAGSSTDGLDHFFILAYTLQAGEAGDLTLNIDGQSGAAGAYVAYINDTFVDTTVYASSGNKDATYTIAGAAEGDVVYLAWVGDSASNRNTQRNSINYNITSVPEPGTYALIGGMFALTFVMLRRRK